MHVAVCLFCLKSLFSWRSIFHVELFSCMLQILTHACCILLALWTIFKCLLMNYIWIILGLWTLFFNDVHLVKEYFIYFPVFHLLQFILYLYWLWASSKSLTKLIFDHYLVFRFPFPALYIVGCGVPFGGWTVHLTYYCVSFHLSMVSLLLFSCQTKLEHYSRGLNCPNISSLIEKWP